MRFGRLLIFILARKKSVKITLIESILNNAIFFKFACGIDIQTDNNKYEHSRAFSCLIKK